MLGRLRGRGRPGAAAAGRRPDVGVDRLDAEGHDAVLVLGRDLSSGRRRLDGGSGVLQSKFSDEVADGVDGRLAAGVRSVAGDVRHALAEDIGL